jgi:hypothetical protein
MKNKTVWNAIIWKTNGDEEFRVFAQRPNFANIYRLINCNMIEFHNGSHEDYGNFEMHCDEEAKLTNKPINKRATNAWYKWCHRTAKKSPTAILIAGDTINGDVAILQKVKQPNEKKEVRSVA